MFSKKKWTVLRSEGGFLVDGNTGTLEGFGVVRVVWGLVSTTLDSCFGEGVSRPTDSVSGNRSGVTDETTVPLRISRSGALWVLDAWGSVSEWTRTQ